MKTTLGGNGTNWLTGGLPRWNISVGIFGNYGGGRLGGEGEKKRRERENRGEEEEGERGRRRGGGKGERGEGKRGVGLELKRRFGACWVVKERKEFGWLICRAEPPPSFPKTPFVSTALCFPLCLQRGQILLR